MSPLLAGKTFSKEIDGFVVTWESDGQYRHWCHQAQPGVSKDILIIMLNPGSLSSDGANLSKDTTLRVLRDAFRDTGANPFVINLFDFAAAKPNVFFENWDSRDNKRLVYPQLQKNRFVGVIYAYGDYEFNLDHGSEIKERIGLVRETFAGIREVELPKNVRGTPKHPLRWQTEKIMPQINQGITDFLRAS